MASVNLQEKANFTRLSRLLVDKGTEALRNTLDAVHPANLPAVLNANRTTLLKLKPRVINDTQWDLLFPPSGNPPDSKTFDVTLLTVLLRNLAGLPPPATGWNAMPPDIDNSLQANITRIKLFRNQVYGHVTSTQVDKITFDNLWQKISKALVDLKIPQKEIDDLKTCPLGPEEEIYEQSLKEWVLKEEECKNMLDDLTRGFGLIHSQQKDDREVIEQIHQRVQQLCTSSSSEFGLPRPTTHDSEESKAGEKHSINVEEQTMQLLRQLIEQNHQGIQQLCTSSSSESELPRPMHNSEESKASGKHSMEEQLLQKLAKHNFKSKIRSKVKFFHPGTREWLLKRIYSWFADEDESRLLLLTAGPGFGKSVFAAKVCEIFEKEGRLAACHFCDFSTSNLNDPMMMLQSLASHMCQNIVGFKEKLLDQLKRPHKADSLKDAFQIYLQNPLDELEVEHCLIVIDGLDESATDDKSDMVKLIADNFPDLPGCVKVLVTSRPELSLRKLDHIEVIEVGVNDVNNQLDILKYLNARLPTLAAKDEMNRSAARDKMNRLAARDEMNRSSYIVIVNAVLDAIVEKCEGSFLYAFHIQHELCKREDLGTITFQDIMSFLPKGMASIYEAYFRRLEIELEAAMKRNPDLFKLLELLVAMKAGLPLKFIARALGLAFDCRETKKIINEVNEAVSCLLYVSDDVITVFHKSVCDWLLANGYDDHEYTVKVSDGEKRLWLLCKQVFNEIKRNVCLGHDLKLTNEVTHALEYGHEYLLACQIEDSFSWFVDMIIVHVLLSIHPKSTRIFSPKDIMENFLRSDLKKILEKALRIEVALSVQLRKRISWHFTEISYLMNHEIVRVFKEGSAIRYSYLESVLDYSPEGCFTDDERKMAEVILAKSPRCVKRNSVGTKLLKPLVTSLFSSDIVAVGVSSSKKLAAIALENGTICVLSLPELIQLWQYSTGHKCISCCTFAPDDTVVLYGKLETVLNIEEKKEAAFFGGEVERFKSCAFSPNGKRLITNDGSDTLKLWDVITRSLVSVLSAGAPVDCCAFTTTGLFIIATDYANEHAYCVWNSITLQRVDQRTSFNGSMLSYFYRNMPSYFYGNKRKKKDGTLISERCNRCFRQECKELIPSERFGIMRLMLLGRPLMSQNGQISSTGIYKEMDCIFNLDSEESLSVIESIHFTTVAAWEIFIETPQCFTRENHFVDIAAIEDDCWLYSDDQKLVVFSAVPRKENQSSLSRPTCVLWCSFSPDGTRLATCTSDGFINMWNVATFQVYQRFRSNIETPFAACWWSDKYLFVCHVINTIPSLSRYPVDRTLKIAVTKKQAMSLCSVNREFSSFWGFLGFSEGYLSFECSMTELVKVVDVKKIGHPKIVILPGIECIKSIAVSSRASFVLGVGRRCYILWKKNETQQSVYNVFVCFDTSLPGMKSLASFGIFARCGECCFSNDSKFAIVSLVFMSPTTVRKLFMFIDVETGIATIDVIHDDEKPTSPNAISKVFCTNTVVIHLTPNMIKIFHLESGKRLESSFLRHLNKKFVIHSKLSPAGTVLAVPRVTGDIELFHLSIPKYPSVPNGQKNWERLSGVKFIFPGLCCLGITPEVKKKIEESLPRPSRFENIPKVGKKIKGSLPGPGRFGNIPKVEKKVKESLPGPGKFGNIPKVEKKVKESLPGPGRFGNIPKVNKKKVKKKF
jgi:WD40 repeat protein